MNPIRPIKFRWTGEVMRPTVPSVAAGMYETGRFYWMEPWEPASSASRGHYFASIKEAWENLPETISDRFPTPDHLRKFCLIREGFRDERTIVAANKAEARRIAAFIRPMDSYAVVVVREAMVVVWTAKSQSVRAMGRKEFQESKQRVLDALSAVIGVERHVLDKNTGQAA